MILRTHIIKTPIIRIRDTLMGYNLQGHWQ